MFKKTALFFTIGLLGAYQAVAQNAYLAPNQVVGNQQGGTFFITAGNGGDGASHIKISGPTASDTGFMGYMAAYNPNNASAITHAFYVRPGLNNFVPAMVVRQDGKVQIGNLVPTNHSDYRLSVEGKLVAQSLYVTTAYSWPDFVFAAGHKRMSLPELEAYLQRNKHLPAVPAASEVEKQGYSVTEMDAKLLQTIEELTLHVIELQKQVEELKNAKASN